MKRSLIEGLNRPLPLLDRLVPLVGDKKEIKIADVGSGPVSKIGRNLDGVSVEVYPSDKRDYTSFWKARSLTPLYPVERQNMEKLTYEDNFFDIVTCVNALDHTIDAMSAVKEMIRVTKPGGWVYIDCALDQRSVSGKHHYWDAKEDGAFITWDDKFNLKDLGFSIEYLDNKGERRHNNVIAILQK